MRIENPIHFYNICSAETRIQGTYCPGIETYYSVLLSKKSGTLAVKS